ncbi:MAG TPA: histidinol-phosphate transaminase [Candidatus Sulfotelmatobacter sp.]|nr:histidinol-phosphate transaminase [Candidatus Sulfotelmatobacter sp.]
MLRPREAVRTLPSYHPPLAGRQGLRLDFNENTIGCSPRVLECLRRSDLEQLARYPEREPVEATVTDFLGVTPAEVLLTNGVDEAIHLLCQTYLESGDEALIVVPTYSMYRIYAMAAGAQVISVPLSQTFQFPTEAITTAITARTRLIAIANPNNPTGTVAAPQDLLQIAHSAPQGAVLIDEAYFEFYGQTILGAQRDFPNLFVARTFSKAYGLAGLRIGVLIGNAEPLRSVRRVSSPYNVNAIALACLPEAIADQPYIQQYVTEVLQARALLERTLSAAGIHFWPSQANFVLARIGSSATDSAEFVEHMRRRGILVRDRSADHGCQGCVRITLGPHAHTVRLLQALQETFEELGIASGAPR